MRSRVSLSEHILEHLAHQVHFYEVLPPSRRPTTSGEFDSVPRRLTGQEEHRLLAARRRMEKAAVDVQRALQQRDRLILELIEDGVRIVDVADVLALTRRAVEQARDRARYDRDG